MNTMTRAPCGKAINDVSNVLKPNPLMTRVEKLEIPPLGIFCCPRTELAKSWKSSQITYTDQAKRKEDPCLVVEESFTDLMPVDDPVLNTRLVALESRNDHQAFVVAEPSVSSGRIGKSVG